MLGKRKVNGKATKCTRFFSVVMVTAMVFGGLGLVSVFGAQDVKAESGTTILFSDDFNDGNYNGWTVVEGSWSAANGYLQATSGHSGTQIKTQISIDATAVTLQYDFRFPILDCRGAAFTIKDEVSGNYISVCPDYSRPWGGGEEIRVSIKVDAFSFYKAYPWELGSDWGDSGWRTVKIVADSGRASVYVDDQIVAENIVYGDATTRITATTLSLGGWQHQNPGTCYDNLIITGSGGGTTIFSDDFNSIDYGVWEEFTSGNVNGKSISTDGGKLKVGFSAHDYHPWIGYAGLKTKDKVNIIPSTIEFTTELDNTNNPGYPYPEHAPVVVISTGADPFPGVSYCGPQASFQNALVFYKELSGNRGIADAVIYMRNGVGTTLYSYGYMPHYTSSETKWKIDFKSNDEIKIYREGSLVYESSTFSFPSTEAYLYAYMYSSAGAWRYVLFDYIHVSGSGGENVPPAQPEGYTQGGLVGEYYNNEDFTDLKIVRIDPTVDFDWEYGSPDPCIGTLGMADSFSAKWSGKIEIEQTGDYIFYTSTDDGVKLWVNEQLIIDEWQSQSETEYSGTITLQAGYYDIKMEYFEDWQSAAAHLSWDTPSGVKEIIPSEYLWYLSDIQPTSGIVEFLSLQDTWSYDLSGITLFDTATNGSLGGADADASLKVWIPEGSFSFTPSIDVLGSYQDGSLQSLSAQATGTVNLGVDVKAEAAVSAEFSKSYNWTIYEFPSKFFVQTIPCPPYVVWEEVKVEIIGGVDVSSNASINGWVQTGLDSSASVSVGVEYDFDTGFSPIADYTITATQRPVTWGWDTSGNITVTPYVKAKVSVLLYSLVGPEFSVSPYLEFDAGFDKVDYYWSLDGGIKFDAGLDLGPFADTGIWETTRYDYQVSIASESHSWAAQTASPKEQVGYTIAENTYLTSMVTSMDLSQGTEDSLTAKLSASQDKLETALQDIQNNDTKHAGNMLNTAKNQLNAFINNVKAQSGKDITVEQADALIADAQTLIGHIDTVINAISDKGKK